MVFRFLGFSTIGTIRRFSFERIPTSGPSVLLNVDADVLLARKYKVSLQELPAICSSLLGAMDENLLSGTVSLTEAEMSAFSSKKSAAASEVAAKRGRFGGGFHANRARSDTPDSPVAPEPEVPSARSVGSLERRATVADESRFGPITSGGVAAPIETTNQLRVRFDAAFRRYSTESAAMRMLTADPSNQSDALANDVSEGSRIVDRAESEYRAVRNEYANRLLRT